MFEEWRRQPFSFQHNKKKSAEHCCVFFCYTSAKFNLSISFHKSQDGEIRKRCIVNVRRDDYSIGHRMWFWHSQSWFPWNSYSLGERGLECGKEETDQNQWMKTLLTLMWIQSFVLYTVHHKINKSISQSKFIYMATSIRKMQPKVLEKNLKKIKITKIVNKKASWSIL